MNTALWKQVSQALTYSPSQQPVGTKANDGDKDESQEKNDQKKVRQGIATGYKAKQKGNPNRSFTVAVIDKARAKLG